MSGVNLDDLIAAASETATRLQAAPVLPPSPVEAMRMLHEGLQRSIAAHPRQLGPPTVTVTVIGAAPPVSVTPTTANASAASASPTAAAFPPDAPPSGSPSWDVQVGEGPPRIERPIASPATTRGSSTPPQPAKERAATPRTTPRGASQRAKTGKGVKATTTAKATTKADTVHDHPSVRGAVVLQFLVAGLSAMVSEAALQPHRYGLGEVPVTLTGLTLVMGLIAGRSRGVMSTLTMLTSLAIAVIQVVAVWPTINLLSWGRHVDDDVIVAMVPQALLVLASARVAWRARGRSPKTTASTTDATDTVDTNTTDTIEATVTADAPSVRAPSMRGPALALGLTMTVDVLAILVRYDGDAPWLATDVRIWATAVGVLSGLFAGRGRGLSSTLAAVGAVVVAVASSWSVLRALMPALSHPGALGSTLLFIAPKLLVIVASLRVLRQATRRDSPAD